MEYQVIDIINNEPTFEKPLNEILSTCKRGGAIKVLDPIEYITDRQRQWYKGIVLPTLAKNDENGESTTWWDTEVKRLCNGLAYLKKEVFFCDELRVNGKPVGIGRLTTKDVGKKNMTLFIEEILTQAVARGWPISKPDRDLRSK